MNDKGESDGVLSYLYLLILFIGTMMLSASCSDKKEKYAAASDELKALPATVDFNFHIKPILSDRCFTCHGPDANKRKAGLRLDLEESAFSELRSGNHAIVAGSPGSSEIIDRLLTDDPELVMPPPDSKLSISEYEIALINKWIDQGAEWKQHWSFISPEKSTFPKTREDWGNNEVDAFVLVKMEQNELSPSKRTSKEKLLRKVTFDLTGLPPSIEELDAFLSDKSKNAYEKVVDGLLASPRYGERLATEWLDVARYADTHGYQGDTERRMWPWRDWVIDAFNKNMPYDQFVTWQLAGDLLADPTREQLIATGFNRNHMMNGEGGITDEEYRVEYVADRTNTTGKAFLGLTMECARCHDHKYDPIKQEEYFGLYAFYNNIEELGMTVNAADVYPYILMTKEDEQRKLDSLDLLISKQRHDIDSYIASLGKDNKGKEVNKKIDLKKGLVTHLPFDTKLPGNKFPNRAKSDLPANIVEKTDLIDGKLGRAVAFDGNNAVHLGQSFAFDANEEFSFSLWVNYPEAVPRADMVHKLDIDFMGERGYHLYINDNKISFSMNHTFDNNYIKVTTVEDFPFGEWTHIAVTYDGLGKAKGIDIAINGKPCNLGIIRDNLFKSMKGYGNIGIGGPNFGGGSIDDFRIYDRKLTFSEIQKLARVALQQSQFAHHLKDGEYQRKRKGLSGLLGLRYQISEFIPQMMIMHDNQDSIRTTFLLNRGAWDDPGEKIAHTTPSSVLAYDDQLPKNRLGLSKWMFDRQHPLTSRVMVNRLWQMVFGRGIVSTPDDFGNQGSLPTHPELLDWLSVDFQENGWDIKQMLKKMVLSETYCQDSRLSKENLEKDKYNLFLARGPRYRMPAEMVRDQALAVSGLLVEKLGGPSVKPYQPKGVWAEKATQTNFFYPQDHGDSLYRRSLYTYWRRTTPPPSMITFDSPDRNFCAVKREATSTPLQALVLLNDVQYVEAARVFAQNLLQTNEKNPVQLIKHAFRMATARKPLEQEIAELLKLLEESKNEYVENPKAVDELLNFGEYPVAKNIDKIELAAYTILTSALLNLDETITKG